MHRVPASRQTESAELAATRRALEQTIFRLEEAQRIGHVGSWIWRPDSGEMVSSSEMFTLAGVAGGALTTVDELMARVQPVDRERLRAAMLAVAEHGRVLEERVQFRRVDGDVRVVDLHGERSADDGSVVVAGTVRDVTEQHLVEVALRKSEETYRRIAETAEEGIWVLDPDGLTAFMNRRMASLLGIGLEEALGVSVHDFVRGPDRTALERHLRLRRQGVTERYELTMVRTDGAELRVLTSASPLLGDHGEYLGAFGMVSDITDRYKAMAALEASRSELAEAQRLARIGSWSFDLRSGASTWSDEQFCLLGYEPGQIEASADRYLERVAPSDRPRVRRLLLRALEHPIRYSLESQVVLPGGEVRWLAVRGEPIVDADGRLVGHRGTSQDVTERHRAAEELAHLTVYDTLTGLPNRALLTDRLAQALVRSTHAPVSVGVLVVDIDRFKLVNDSRGHAAGDVLLRELAQRLVKVMEPTAMVGRFGGDELVVLCEQLVDDAHLEQLADLVTDALHEPFSVQGTDVVLTASIGMAVGRAGDDASALLSSADAAMYRAKELGRDRRVRFDGSIRLHAQQRLALERELRHAVEEGQMRLCYQPVVDLRSGGIVGVEALVRWDHPTRGEVSPNEFIPLAEELGLIVPLGAWVLDEACRALVALHSVDPSLTMAVNVSARQLRRPDFADVAAAVLERSGVDAGSVILEVTETELMADADLFVEALAALRALGLHLAVDDFGTGFSSLAYLQRFPSTSSRSTVPSWSAAAPPMRPPRSSRRSSRWPVRSACARSPKVWRPRRSSPACGSSGVPRRRASSSRSPARSRRWRGSSPPVCAGSAGTLGPTDVAASAAP